MTYRLISVEVDRYCCSSYWFCSWSALIASFIGLALWLFDLRDPVRGKVIVMRCLNHFTGDFSES